MTRKKAFEPDGEVEPCSAVRDRVGCVGFHGIGAVCPNPVEVGVPLLIFYVDVHRAPDICTQRLFTIGNTTKEVLPLSHNVRLSSIIYIYIDIN